MVEPELTPEEALAAATQEIQDQETSQGLGQYKDAGDETADGEEAPDGDEAPDEGTADDESPDGEDETPIEVTEATQ